MTNTNQITASFHRLGCGVAWYCFSCRWITVSNSVCYRTTRKSSGGGVNVYVWSLFLLFWKGNQDLDARSFHQPRQRSHRVKHIPIHLHTRLRFRDDHLVVAVVADNPAETCFKGFLDTSNITLLIQRHPLWEVCISPAPDTHTHKHARTLWASLHPNKDNNHDIVISTLSRWRRQTNTFHLPPLLHLFMSVASFTTWWRRLSFTEFQFLTSLPPANELKYEYVCCAQPGNTGLPTGTGVPHSGKI